MCNGTVAHEVLVVAVAAIDPQQLVLANEVGKSDRASGITIPQGRIRFKVPGIQPDFDLGGPRNASIDIDSGNDRTGFVGGFRSERCPSSGLVGCGACAHERARRRPNQRVGRMDTGAVRVL
jgi:hypothetical protein